MARILSLGSALMDIYLVDHDDLRPTAIGGEAIFGKVLVGSKVDIDQMRFEVGGGGVNSAVTFSRNGHEAILMANIGRDMAGQTILGALDREGVDNSYIESVARKNTGTSVILLDSRGGERTILTCRGASNDFANFKAEDLELTQPDYLYITTLGGDLDTLEQFLVRAREMGVKVMLNPGVKELRQTERLIGLLKLVDILLVNRAEARELVPGASLGELLYHLSGYVSTVIITDGMMGGIATDGEEVYRFGIYEDVKVKDATGAGDAFGSGFLSAIAVGKSFKQALVFASANSTAVVSCVGANGGVLSHGALSHGAGLHPMPIQKL